MALIGSSPWGDLARMGEGLGQSLGAIFMQVPAMRAQQAREQQELGLRERQIAAQEELNKLHGLFYQARADAVPEELEIKRSIAEASNALKAIQGEWTRTKAELERAKDQREADELSKRLVNLEREGQLLNQKMQLYPEVQRSIIERNQRIGQKQPPNLIPFASQFVASMRGPLLDEDVTLDQVLDMFSKVANQYGGNTVPMSPLQPLPFLSTDSSPANVQRPTPLQTPLPVAPRVRRYNPQTGAIE